MNVITNYRFINEDVHIEIASETLIISYALFLKYQLKIGLEMTPSLKEQIANDVLFERLYLEAKTYLKRMRTRDEVKTFLLKISSKETIIKQVIDHLKDKKYLDDMSYIKRYIQTHEHYGPNKCVFELMKKGIEKMIFSVFYNPLILIQNFNTSSKYAVRKIKSCPIKKNFKNVIFMPVI
jgi:SOS response regulatory protein OraA/RecX